MGRPPLFHFQILFHDTNFIWDNVSGALKTYDPLLHFRGYTWIKLQLNMKNSYWVVVAMIYVKVKTYVMLASEILTYFRLSFMLEVMKRVYSRGIWTNWWKTCDPERHFHFIIWWAVYRTGHWKDFSRIANYVEAILTERGTPTISSNVLWRTT